MKKIKKNNTVSQTGLTVITTHLNPDYDAVSSMIAASKLYPTALLVFPGGQEKNIRNFFIQSLIYMLNTAKISDLDFKNVTKLVIVDTRQAERIGKLSEILKNENLEIHLYDHHPNREDDIKGTIEVVEKVGATVTILTEIISRRKIELTPQEATMLALGIYEDTGSFSFQSTTVRDYLAAATLLEQGSDLNIISELSVRELTAEQLSLLNDLVSNAETFEINNLTLVIATAQREQYIDNIAVLAHKMMDILGIGVLFIIVGMENRVQLVARSRLGSTVNAALVAQQFGGGGHNAAAAASIKDMTVIEAKDKLERILADLFGQYYNAENIMVSPAITIYNNETIEEANEKMAKYSINLLLVIDEKNKFVGYISDHNTSKALYHDLGKMPISTFANTEIKTVGKEATFQTIKEYIVDRKQRALPVLSPANEVVGVITRTDLLQLIADATNEPNKNKQQENNRNFKKIMQQKLPTFVFEILQNIGQLADEKNIQVYVVGGFVRDLITKRENLDIDITLNGNILSFIDDLAKKYSISKVIYHPHFQSATIELEDAYLIDFSTTRLEYYEHPGSLPIVETGSIKLDMYRRDFTINSLAISLNKENFGKLLDYYRGYQDIRDGYIRIIHNLSFIEDPTRAFRAFKFEKRLNFSLTKMTENLIHSAVKGSFLNKIHKKRIISEIQLILKEENPGPILLRLAEFDILKNLHSKIVITEQHEEIFKQIHSLKEWYKLSFPEKVNKVIWLVYFMAITDNLSFPELEVLFHNSNLKRKDTEILLNEKFDFNRNLNYLRKNKNIEKFKASQIYTLLQKFSSPSILYLTAKINNPIFTKFVVNYLTNYINVKTQISATEIINLGVKKGARVGELIAELKLLILDAKCQNKEDEINYIKANLNKI